NELSLSTRRLDFQLHLPTKQRCGLDDRWRTERSLGVGNCWLCQGIERKKANNGRKGDQQTSDNHRPAPLTKFRLSLTIVLQFRRPSLRTAGSGQRTTAPHDVGPFWVEWNRRDWLAMLPNPMRNR